MLTLLLALMIGNFAFGGEGSPINSAIRLVTSPVERLFSQGLDGLQNLYAYLHDFDRIKAENSELRKTIANMEDEIRTARGANEENEKLRSLLELMKKDPSFVPITTVQVIGRSSSSWTSTITISGGSVDGIEVGDSVITEQNFLVGQVVSVGATTAEVRTIIDIDSSIGALIDRSGVSGVAFGDFELMNRGVLRLGLLLTDDSLLNGDTILTSGSGEIFPQGLVIGKISAYRIDDSGMNWYGEITPSAELDSLTLVIVVR
jgi:rod shape-determining protein MreC